MKPKVIREVKSRAMTERDREHFAKYEPMFERVVDKQAAKTKSKNIK
jgi:hypothetical protein